MTTENLRTQLLEILQSLSYWEANKITPLGLGIGRETCLMLHFCGLNYTIILLLMCVCECVKVPEP